MCLRILPLHRKQSQNVPRLIDAILRLMEPETVELQSGRIVALILLAESSSSCTALANALVVVVVVCVCLCGAVCFSLLRNANFSFDDMQGKKTCS